MITFSNYKIILSRTLKVCAWIIWAVAAFYFAVPYYYAFSGTRIGAMAIVSFSFFAGLLAWIGVVFYLLGWWAKRESHSPWERTVLWGIGIAAVWGVFLLVFWGVVEVVEYLVKKA